MSIGRALRKINPAAAGGWTMPVGTLLWLRSNYTTGGGLWEDQSGSGNHATLAGATLGAASGLYTSSSGYATVADTPSLSVSGTICAWIRPTGVSSNPLFVSGWNSVEYHLATYGTLAASGYNNQQVGAPGTLVANVWQHVALRWTGALLYCLLDGSPGSSIAASALTVSQTLFLGRQNAGASNRFVGDIDDLFIIPSDQGVAGIQDIRANSPGTHA